MIDGVWQHTLHLYTCLANAIKYSSEGRLYISDVVAARLGRGALSGRVDRHGYLYHHADVKSCSSKRLLRSLQTAQDVGVHLCAHTPCGYDNPRCVHAPMYTVIDQAEELKIEDLAVAPPASRMWRIIWTDRSLCASIFSSGLVSYMEVCC